jgi:hypothetical protein
MDIEDERHPERQDEPEGNRVRKTTQARRPDSWRSLGPGR